MISHYERSQTQRSVALKEENEWRTGRREAIERLTEQVRFLSTIPVEKAKFRGASSKNNDMETGYRLREL